MLEELLLIFDDDLLNAVQGLLELFERWLS